jgi:hypothetical protein
MIPQAAIGALEVHAHTGLALPRSRPGDMDMPEPASRKRWDFSEPQTALAAIGVVATLATGLFGLPFAFPTGQDLLCKNLGVSCQRVEFTNIRFTAWAVEHERWCAEASANATPGGEPPPPGGYYCSMDFSGVLSPDYSGQIGYVERTPAISIAGHLSMDHPLIRYPIDFTMQPACSRTRPGAELADPIACELAPPRALHEVAYPTLEAEDRAAMRSPNGRTPSAILGTLLPDETAFNLRYRLEFDGQPYADLEPGVYEMRLVIGAPGESVKPADATLRFEVIEPPA